MITSKDRGGENRDDIYACSTSKASANENKIHVRKYASKFGDDSPTVFLVSHWILCSERDITTYSYLLCNSAALLSAEQVCEAHLHMALQMSPRLRSSETLSLCPATLRI